MIKNIIQYIKDVEYTMRGSDADDFIWIYAPLVICTWMGFVVGLIIINIMLH